MSSKKKLSIVTLIILAVLGAFVIYSANRQPSVIPEAGRYSNNGWTTFKLETASNTKSNTKGKFLIDKYGSLTKQYTVKYNLFHGDIVIVDWLENRKLKFKVTSDTSMVVLEDCGVFEKGQAFKQKT